MNKLSLEEAFAIYFHDKYSFSDFCTVNINLEYTTNFFSRKTYSPSKKLKEFQQFLNAFIFNYMKVNNNVVFSYRKGTSTKDAVIPHRNNKYIFTTDIKDFFNHIELDFLKKIIKQNKDNVAIIESDIIKYMNNILEIVTYEGILPIGAPTSPIISNAYLFGFDNNLEKYCQNKGISYTRYSDDFIFSASNLDIFKEIPQIINEEFKSIGYESFNLNIEKTKIQKRGNKVQVLGLHIAPNGNITIDNKIKNDIEVLLHFYKKDKIKFKDFFEKKFNSNMERLSGLINHIQSVDKQYISKLKKKYGAFLIDSLIHRDLKND